MAKIRDVSGYQGVYELHKINQTFPADGSETDTGEDLPDDGLVVDFWMYVNTAEATGGTKTLDVGLLSSESGGDANGFGAALDVSATGFVKPTLASGGQTRGALLYADESGAGVLVPESHVLNGTAKSVTVTAGSADFAEMDVDLYFVIARRDRDI